VNDEILQHMRELEQTVKELQTEVAALKSGEKSPPAAVPQSNLVSSTSATPTAAPPGPSLAGLLGPTSVSGFVDVYYGQNFNNPTSRSNAFRFFDGATNQFGLNMVELVLDKAPDANNSRTGYRVALGFGQAMNAVNGSDFGGLGFDQIPKGSLLLLSGAGWQGPASGRWANLSRRMAPRSLRPRTTGTTHAPFVQLGHPVLPLRCAGEVRVSMKSIRSPDSL